MLWGSIHGTGLTITILPKITSTAASVCLHTRALLSRTKSSRRKTSCEQWSHSTNDLMLCEACCRLSERSNSAQTPLGAMSAWLKVRSSHWLHVSASP
ncbi:hypothetical protein BAUCODRAFT_266749 [Baudoinia panamericana UAMH 10762]|uniref:Uncharacterized protein n=1 Tax=Baudoinia panamericana (strain UAMH 10762) TaxID=717646 RepID=M2LFV8_BAUPA|nr:uncharacterized protein BAUCODRAFT_266749 [Baudoinia panamericana UAMH 10762]EMC92917.1 hypothetical protein BAUCODRAFT_266749 [Baudoinia panamericana UAMH 10762]